MNAQDLKNSILQLAIQGKLVEQRVEEGTAKELLEQIKAEKEQLIKEKKIKREKSLSEITADKIPFDIPESWAWVRLGEIGETNIGLTYKPSDISNNGTIVLRSSNIFNGILVYDDIVRVDMTIPENKMCKSGDILICARNGSKRLVGKAAIIDREGMSFGAFMAIYRSICNKYVLRVIHSTYFRNALFPETGTTTINQITQDSLRQFLLPLPPLEEQKRIVAKIEELLPFVEKYDKAYSEVEELNKKFPEDMQKSILQYAIQGKLVEQREEEGTAEELYQQIQNEKAKLIKEGMLKKQKQLAEITEDEIPFDIPESWRWVRLGNLSEKIGSGSTPTGGKSVYKESGIKFLRSQNVYNDGLRLENVAYISEDQNRPGSIVKEKDILLNITGGSIGRCALVPDGFDIANINQHVMIIRNILPGNRFFMHYILISPYVQSMIMSVQVGVSREGLSAEKLKNFLIPLPPLKEQMRIVAKIEELMPYHNKLVD